MFMKVINLLLPLFLLFFSSCRQENEHRKRERLENKIIEQTWRQLEREKKLIPIGGGSRITPGNELIGIYFKYFQPVTKDKARQLVIYAAETLLSNLNSDEKLNQLIEKPYLMDWIEIVIYMYNVDYSEVEYPGFKIVHLKRDNIEYITEKTDYEVIKEETYQEALEKITEN